MIKMNVMPCPKFFPGNGNPPLTRIFCSGSQENTSHYINAGETCLLMMVIREGRCIDHLDEWFCKACAAKLYQELKPTLNSDLWAFQ